MLCDWGAAGSVRCWYRGKGCAGSVDGHCWPYIAWSGGMHSSSVYFAPIHLASGSVGDKGACDTGYCISTVAVSVPVSWFCSPMPGFLVIRRFVAPDFV